MHNSNKLEIKISDKLIKSKILHPKSVQVSRSSPTRFRHLDIQKLGFFYRVHIE